MPKHSIKIGLIQMKVSDDFEENLEKTARYIKKAARKGAEIVCLQELFAYRYFAQTEDDRFFALAEPVPGRLSRFLADCASSNRVLLIGGSIYEKGDDGKFYNTSLIFDAAGSLAGKYRKMHIRHDPNYFEHHYFSAGDIGYVQANSAGPVTAPLIAHPQPHPQPPSI